MTALSLTRPARARMTELALRHFVAFTGVSAVAGYALVYVLGLAQVPIRSDAYSYYAYLPATLIYHDPTLEALATDCCGGAFPAFTAISRWPSTGRLVNPHPIGVAVMTLPFFLVAHFLSRWSNLPNDGFSLFYQYGAGLAGPFYLTAGLWLLRSFLARYFSPGVVLGTLVSITWGTNLYHYATFDALFSHVFSFCLLCALLYLTPRWLEERSYSTSIKVGTVAGLIVLTRHPNALLLVFFVLYGITDRQAIRERLGMLRGRWREVIAAATTALLIVLPQAVLYSIGTGRWLASPYGETWWFNFTDPKIVEVLLGTEKGLLFWSPVLGFSIAGLFVMHRTIRPMLLPTLVFLPVNVYLIASWWDWQFGGSYGHRAFTDSLAVLATSMAGFYAWASQRPRLATVIAVAASLAVVLSVVQMAQYWMGIIPFSGTTWELYRSIFLKLRV